MTTNKKLVIAVVALSLALLCAIGGTLAFLVAQSNVVTNTFTYGDINIDLSESENLNLKMIPGNTITKDPTVTVLKDSEACWLFVEIGESTNFDDFMTYEIADGWTQGNGTDIPANVYYCEVSAATEGNIKFEVLKGNLVSVKDTVTKDMLNSESFVKPKLTFKAYAVQKDNVASADDAWKLVGTKGVPANS